MFMKGGPDWIGFEHRGFRAKFGPLDVRGRRARRGDIKYLILGVLARRPAHGYDIMKQLEAWRRGRGVSAGSVYPTLQMLEDAGYVTSETIEGKRTFTIADSGRALLEERVRDGTDDGEDDADAVDGEVLRDSIVALVSAVMQAARVGDRTTAERLRRIMDRARKEIYDFLSETK